MRWERTRRAPSGRPSAARGRALAFVLGLTPLPLVVVACVIADPPTDLPRLGDMRPTIVRASVVPSTSAVLSQWPDAFVVPVELSNPQAVLQYAVFLDYNPATADRNDPSDTSLMVQGKKTTEDSPAQGRIRMIEVASVPRPTDGCHVVDMVVQLDNGALPTVQTLRNPPSPGGDTVTWFFNLSGDLSGCPPLDAGIRSIVDAGADGEAGSTDQ